MSDDPIDLASLVPPLDDLVTRIDARCAPLLSARRERRTLVQIAGWWRPTLAAALLIAIGCSIVLRRVPPPRRGMPNATTQLARGLGVPSVLADRITSTVPPPSTELLPEIGR
ncbi:MAG TPA: hypothetical protein VGJ18_03230 [Gemmatimonadaceae bacterium]|jgi:hypothetical protein